MKEEKILFVTKKKEIQGADEKRKRNRGERRTIKRKKVR